MEKRGEGNVTTRWIGGDLQELAHNQLEQRKPRCLLQHLRIVQADHDAPIAEIEILSCGRDVGFISFQAVGRLLLAPSPLGGAHTQQRGERGSRESKKIEMEMRGSKRSASDN